MNPHPKAVFTVEISVCFALAGLAEARVGAPIVVATMTTPLSSPLRSTADQIRWHKDLIVNGK